MHSSLFTPLKSGRSFKKQVRRMTKYFCPKYTPSRFLYVSERLFFSPEYGPVLYHKGHNSLSGHFSPEEYAHQPEREQEQAHQRV